MQFSVLKILSKIIALLENFPLWNATKTLTLTLITPLTKNEAPEGFDGMLGVITNLSMENNSEPWFWVQLRF